MLKGVKQPGLEVKHILCICAHGNNRSVTMAHALKYVKNFETLTAGVEYHTPETLKMLYEWADVITVPEDILLKYIPEEYKHKIKFYNVGPDIYPRPFNKVLDEKVRKMMNEDRI
jgi:predicted protein tyrosine phosphatase